MFLISFFFSFFHRQKLRKREKKKLCQWETRKRKDSVSPPLSVRLCFSLSLAHSLPLPKVLSLWWGGVCVRVCVCVCVCVCVHVRACVGECVVGGGGGLELDGFQSCGWCHCLKKVVTLPVNNCSSTSTQQLFGKDPNRFFYYFFFNQLFYFLTRMHWLTIIVDRVPKKYRIYQLDARDDDDDDDETEGGRTCARSMSLLVSLCQC